VIRSNHRAPALALAAALTAALPADRAGAVVTATWVVDSYGEWDAGEGEHVLISSEGEIKPGWDTRRIGLEFDAAWAMARASDGSVLLGSDDQGAIYRVRGDKAAKLVAIPGAVAVVALAVGGDGTVYAGTMPSGEVWTVDAAGKARKLAALPGAETVWSLALDSAGKTLYAGTGPDGKLFRIDPKGGAASVAFETGDKRVMSLAATRDGAVWLGTSEEAMVFRFDPATKTARAMGDFDANEVTALAPAGGGVIVGANEFDEPSTTGTKTAAAADDDDDESGEKAKPPKAGDAPGADKAAAAAKLLPRAGARKGKGALYRLDADGRLEQLHALTQTYVTSVGVGPDGRVYAGAGAEGRIYLVDIDDSVSTAFDVKERQIARLVSDGRGLAFATADGAAFYTATGAADKATYTSKVFDAKAAAKFGRIVWHGSGVVKLQTRTGNIAKPGVGWSKWQAADKPGRAGGESWGARVDSPGGRYIQFRVLFGGAGPDAVVRKAALYHLPANRATRVTSVTVEAGGGKKLVTMQTGAAKPRSPVRKVEWKVDNPDSDETVYKLAVRRDGDAAWRPLATASTPLTDTDYEWNTETFPDGYYRLRVTASDRRANSNDRALQAHRMTPLFLVDNNRPEVSGVNIRYPEAAARATDAMSAIAEASFSVDDRPWQVAAAGDALFDDLSEVIRISLPRDLTPGMHTLAIRAADEAGNIGSASVTFRVGK
jgi:hypothetical protein